MARESLKHEILKDRATKWLRSRGCTDIRYEVTIDIPLPKVEGWPSKMRIDVVGFRDNQAVLGIECGNLHALDYEEAPFPIFHLPFDALKVKSADDGDEANLAGCIPVHREQIYVTEELPDRSRKEKRTW